MTDYFDVAAGVASINRAIREHGFTARDADKNDFQHGTDQRLRFKTGTSHGEVTITVWQYSRQIDVIRCLNQRHLAEAKYVISDLCNSFLEGKRV